MASDMKKNILLTLLINTKIIISICFFDVITVKGCVIEVFSD